MCKKIDYKELYEVLEAYNVKVNLTAIEGYENYMVKHIEDSKLGLPYISGRVLDIGSGAGFPGLVIKNEKPECDVTLIDSVRKKVDYLKHVIERFGLDGIRAVHTRIEDFPEREAFDTVTARAVARLVTLAEYALPFVRKGGAFVAYKTPDDAELKEAERAIGMLGGRVETVKDMTPGDMSRRLIVIRKVKSTPAGYPRRMNKPRTSPLT